MAVYNILNCSRISRKLGGYKYTNIFKPCLKEFSHHLLKSQFTANFSLILSKNLDILVNVITKMICKIRYMSLMKTSLERKFINAG